MRKLLSIYFLLLLVFGLGISAVLQVGSRLQPAGIVTAGAGTSGSAGAASPAKSSGPLGAMLENLHHPLGLLLMQVIVIIVAARLMGHLVRKVGQPAVIGEMAAGLMLGPSLLGWVFPSLQGFIFPVESLGSLKLMSQIGVVLFMFLVGLELDLKHLHQKAHTAVVVSHASIVIPFMLGASFSLLIYRALAPAHVAFTPFALFVGIAMSITAFPVLARIIEERGLTTSHLGITAIACAAVDDVTAWCILALVVAIVKANGIAGAFYTVGFSVLFTGAMLLLIKPRVERYLAGIGTAEKGGGKARLEGLVPGVVCFVFAAALCTEVIGIHALFGAFLAGVLFSSHSEVRTILKERLESFSSSFLLPLFFAFTGLRTQIGSIEGWENWLICAGLMAIAIIGKLGGSMLAARWTGANWHDAFAIGALMNTRGLMELIVLNLGYDLGILSPPIFAMMVLMALGTTFMTAPLLALGETLKARHSARIAEVGVS